MSEQDRLRRAIARMRALKDNLPPGYEVEEDWVQEFHGAISGLEEQLSMDLEEFKLPISAMYRSVASGNYLTGEVTYRERMWCQRAMLIQKVDALLYYLRDLYGEKAL